MMNSYYSNDHYNPLYTADIERTLNAATEEYARLSVFRFDLRFPADGAGRNDDNMISRFFDALKYHAAAQINAKRDAGISCNNQSSLRYVWCREYGEVNGNRHYHVVLMVNKDMYRYLGEYVPQSDRRFDSLANIIQKAWCSALKLSLQQYFTLVHFPEYQPCIWVERNNPGFAMQRDTAYGRARYLAKEYSKRYGDGRSFGCSQLTPSVIGRRQ